MSPTDGPTAPDPPQSELLRRLALDEALRSEIRAIIERPQRSRTSRFLRHPLVAVFLGFILTGIVATTFAWVLERADREREEAAARRVAGIEAVNELASLIYERRVRAELLASSLKRNAGLSELRERKEAYDEAYVKWNTSLQRNNLTIRDIVGSTRYSQIEARIQYGLTPHLEEIDRYLTAGYDARIASDESWSYDTTRVGRTLQSILDCGYVITQDLWVTANLFDNLGADWERSRAQARQELDSHCPV